jgi:1-deoxy-D-xylulose-5-phosphate synthase
MVENGYQARVIKLGIPDKFVGQGAQQELWEECGYDVKGIAQALRDLAGYSK